MKFATKAVHAGVKPDPTTGAVMTPIYQTSTYSQESPGKHKGYEYARTQNPTRSVLEASLAALENAAYGLCYASGLSAIDAVLKLLEPGDEVIASHDLYGGTYRIFTKIFSRYGIRFHFTAMDDPADVRALVNEKTRLIWTESPTNPMMHIVDIEACGKVAKEHDLLFCVDNTFATPYVQNPISMGADIVMHSVTKYLAGHSDVVMGALVMNDPGLYEQLKFIQNSSGAVPGPQDCFLTLRGIKTLHLRMRQHCANGREVAEFLADHDRIQRIYWPGYTDHPHHDVAERQMRDFGGMISFTLKGDSKEEAFRVLEKFELFTLAESLGGVESLANHPATMTHASIPPEEREKIGVVDSLIRLSVGIEDPDDLILDLENALK